MLLQFPVEHVRPMPQHLHVEFAPDEFVDVGADAAPVVRLASGERGAFRIDLADRERAMAQVLRKAGAGSAERDVARRGVVADRAVEKVPEPFARGGFAGLDDLRCRRANWGGQPTSRL